MDTTLTKSEKTPTVGRLISFSISERGRVLSINPDGSDRKVVVRSAESSRTGIVVDVEAGHIYWTNMGVPKPERRLHRACRHRRAKSQDHRSPGRHLHAKAAPSREENRQALLVGSRRDARHASESRWLGHRNPRGDGPGRHRTGRDATKWCVGITVDPERGQIYWTQKGPDNAGRAASSAPISKSRRARARPTAAISKCCSTAARADRSRARSDRSRPVLDGSRGSAPRQHGQSRRRLPDREAARSARDRAHPSDGGNRHSLDVQGGRMFMTDLAGSVY